MERARVAQEELVLVPMGRVRPQPLAWLWPGRLAGQEAVAAPAEEPPDGDGPAREPAQGGGG